MNLPPTEASPDARYLVLSDMHFGTPESSINSECHRNALVDYVVRQAPWAEIVLTGDLLDANLSTFRRAVEGAADAVAPIFGFRQFLEQLDRYSREVGRSGLAGIAKRWVYVPGNHDYKIWDVLSSQVMFEDVLDAGESLTSVQPPLISYKWPDGASFFAGIFTRYGVRERVFVEYPNHVLSFRASRTMVLTHGHYLDASQTRFHHLAKNLEGLPPAAVRGAVRDLVIETAQYQSVANAVSFRRDTTRFVNGLVGPDGLLDKLKNVITRVAAWLAAFGWLRKGRLRGEPLSRNLAHTITIYLRQFCRYNPLPRWFVFGHTHRQGHIALEEPALDLYNVGSCYLDNGRPITFLQIDTDSESNPNICLKYVDKSGSVR